MTEHFSALTKPRPPGAPRFPHFKSLELADREVIETFTRQFEPYSDFCFSTLVFYDGDGHTRWCWLNGNLVLHLHDGFGPGAYLTFLGCTEAAATAATLIDYAEGISGPAVLRRVPEISTLAITNQSGDFHIEEDRDGFDYVYSLESLAKLDGPMLSRLRRDVSLVKRRYAHYRVAPLDLCDQSAHTELRAAVSLWRSQKNGSDTLDRYCLALENCLLNARSFHLIGVGILIDDSLVGFSVMEQVNDHWLLSHFKGVDPQYANLAGYLLHQVAARGHESLRTHLNYQEDLGELGLRRFKMKCAPSGFLRKFSISLKPGGRSSR